MRLAILVAFAALAALASAAHAQTTCMPDELGRAGCDPVAAQPEVDPSLVTPYACNFAERMTLGPQVCQARKVAETHRRIGELMHAGRCDEATKAARTTGDADYAGRIQEFCADRSHTASAPSALKLSTTP
jgi:hypothetical protein